MSQRSFASAEFGLKKKRTCHEKLLGDMERVVPWALLITVIEPLHPSSGRVGRQSMGVSKMLRMVLLQQRYGLANEAFEYAIYDIQALRDFVSIDLCRESVPDAATLLKFRRLLVTNDLTKALFEKINAHIAQQGLLMRAGLIVDATIIAASSSTKNASGERDPEVHQAKKGTQRHHGVKAYIGVDAQSGIVHSLVSTAANVNYVTQAGELLHAEEAHAFGDAGYRGINKREEAQGPQWHIAMQPGKRKQLSNSPRGQMLKKVEKIKVSNRDKVKRPFHVIKNLFRYRKTSYRELAKNHTQLLSLFELANLVITKKRLLAIHGGCAA